MFWQSEPIADRNNFLTWKFMGLFIKLHILLQEFRQLSALSESNLFRAKSFSFSSFIACNT